MIGKKRWNAPGFNSSCNNVPIFSERERERERERDEMPWLVFAI